MTTRPLHYLGLDLIRFAAALSVVFFHLGYSWWLPHRGHDMAFDPFAETLTVAKALVRWGWIGVPIFFVLSGFVIAFSAEGRSARDFVRGRAMRLYPGAWLCATATLLLARWDDPGALDDFARSLTLLPIGPWISGVYWTLAVEIVFYAAVAATIVAGVPMHRVGYAIGGASTLFWLSRLVDLATGRHLHAVYDAIESPLGTLTLLPSGCYFGLGVMLWVAARRGVRADVLLASGVFVASGLVAALASGRYQVLRDGGHVLQAGIPAALWLCGLAAIAGAIWFNNRIWERLGRWAAPIRTIGLATYPLYLVHSEVGRRLMLELDTLPPLARFGVAVFATCMLALLIVRLEVVTRRWLERLVARRAPREVAPSLP